jgi:putative membrane protein
MLLEALLAYAHIAAILGLVVFMTSQAALCRVEWMNGAVVHRLGRLQRLTLIAALAVLATGLARACWGAKGWDWAWSQPLLHLKLTGFILISSMAIPPARAYRRWRAALVAGRGLPPEGEVRQARRWVMIQAHALLLLPLAGTLLARGLWTR